MEKLNIDQLAAVEEMLALIKNKASLSFKNPCIIGYNPGCEDADIERVIKDRGYAILGKRDMEGVGTWYGHAQEIKYQSPKEIRYAYTLNFRSDVDAFGQESIISRMRLSSRAVADIIDEARQKTKAAHEEKLKKLNILDEKLPPLFRQILCDKKLQVFANDIYQHGLTLDAIKMWKQTAAYNMYKDYLETGKDPYTSPILSIKTKMKSLLVWAYNFGVGTKKVQPHSTWAIK